MIKIKTIKSQSKFDFYTQINDLSKKGYSIFGEETILYKEKYPKEIKELKQKMILKHGDKIINHENGLLEIHEESANGKIIELHYLEMGYYADRSLFFIEKKSEDSLYKQIIYHHSHKISFVTEGKFEIDHNQKFVKHHKEYVVQGKSVEYYESGSIASVRFYKNGAENGKRINYDKNGFIWMVENYVDGIKDGDEIEYFTNNNCNKRIYRVYINGIIKEKTYFSKDDRIISENEYYEKV